MTKPDTSTVERKCGFWHGHNWGAWEQLQMDGTAHYAFRSIPVPFTRLYQRRICKDCGYMQQEEIKV